MYQLDVPSITTTSHGLYCHLPIIQSLTNGEIAIAILACKWESRYYVGLVLQRVSYDTTPPSYAIERRSLDADTEWDDSLLEDTDGNPPSDGLFFVPDMRSCKNELAEHADTDHVRSEFWRDFTTRPPKLQWMDIYIKYYHEEVNYGLFKLLRSSDDITLTVPKWVQRNLCLLGFKLDISAEKNLASVTSLRRFSFKREASRRKGAKSYNEQFEIWIGSWQIDRSRGRRNDNMPFAAYARILASGEDPGLPHQRDFSEVATWDGFSRAFGDNWRTVRLSFIQSAGSRHKFEVCIGLEGAAYSALQPKYAIKDL
jgi:hypothetical protein